MKVEQAAKSSFLLLFALLLFCLPGSGIAADWDFSQHSVPLDQIMGGGPPRDGIPALTSPKFVPGKGVRFVQADEQVLGVVLNGVAKAYPTRILSWHELVNDYYRDLPVLVSW